MKLLLENFRRFMSEGIHTEDKIIAIPQSDTSYFGHSTSSDPSKWIKTGLRMPSGGMGNLGITSVPMPSDGKEFLEHLRKRVTTNYYNVGPWVVVLAIPPEFVGSSGYVPETLQEVLIQAMPLKNVKVLEPDPTREEKFVIPTRFIRGYYDGDERIFVDNPNWEQNPAPTKFGIAAEKAFLQAQEEEADVEPSPGAAAVVGVADDYDDDLWETNFRRFISEEASDEPVATIGDLSTAVEIIRKNQKKEQQLAQLKKVGGLAAKIGLGLVTAGLSDQLQSAADAADAMKDIYDVFASPEATNSGKLKNNPWVKLLGIDEEFSKIIEDGVEREFLKNYIKKYTTGLAARIGTNSPLPNFTRLFAKSLNKTYLQDSPLFVSTGGGD